MFREMRRKRQQMSLEETGKILETGSFGVLSVQGDDGYPYGVPISYVYDSEKIYLHCAKTGHKIDGIRKNPKVSFCVTGQDLVVPEEYTSYFKSVIVFGHARILEKDREIRVAAEKLAVKYYPDDSEEHRREIIESAYARLCMIELTIDHMTGKKAIELVGAEKSSR